MSKDTTSLLVQGYEVVIGFETHAQLTTQSKIFSRASTSFGAEPNTNASAVDFALPGALPVMNKGAVQRAIEFGLAVNAHIAEQSVFARKNYFYPDLPKGYQISQFEIPVVQGGVVEFFLDGEKKAVRLVRAHLEEDAGKSLHEDFIGMSGIDLNRAGTPLLEIVTEPDMRSTLEAVAYAKELHKIVTWIGICDGNMQEGSFRCDANVSVRKPGAPLGTRREIKNLNSFEFMQQAMDYEIRWQIEQIEDGHAIQQATVLFDPDTGETRSMRSKEDAADYRYFPDPDLPPLVISREWVAEIRARMLEPKRTKEQRFISEYLATQEQARIATSSIEFARFFETTALLAAKVPDELLEKVISQTVTFQERTRVAEFVLEEVARAKIRLVFNWFVGEFLARLNREKIAIKNSPVGPRLLVELIHKIAGGTISNNAAKQVFDALWSGEGQDVDAIIEAKGLKQMSDTGELEAIIDDVLAANAKNVEEVKAGNAKAFNALVGQAMKASKGKANPAQVNELLKKKLG
ncbi:MAG: Asp-tRNA(Asn)/Glu-tRNA(Gln) amidotransferase subunit GatB [Pseudomonadota bacterium]|nr:Asp-tRNA(Asn)/Glu-tRNA(Gln) amidotransferase subunit GatB [Pseudomonadota bacterium]